MRMVSQFAAVFVITAFCACGPKSNTVTKTNITGIYLLEDSHQTFIPSTAITAFNKGQFKQPDADELNAGFTKSIFWLAYHNPTLLPPDSLVLYIGDHHINRIHFYHASDTGIQLLHTTGDYFPDSQKPLKTTGYYFPISDSGLYIARIDKSNESLQLAYWLSSQKTAIAEENRNGLIMALLTGMIFLMVIFGMYLLFLTKDPIYFFYTAYLMAGWLWVLANSGYGFQYIWGDAPWFASKARPVFAVLSGALSMKFMLRFVGTSIAWIKKLVNVFYATMWVYVAIILLFNVQGYKSSWWMYLQVLIPVTTILYVAVALFFLIRSSLKGNRFATFYLAGILVLLSTTFIQAAMQLGGVNQFQYFFSHFGLGIGYVVESLIITAGLAYRFNQYRRDKELLLQQVNKNQLENIRIITEVQHNERSQIANQLHDVAGSMLSAARLNLSVLRQQALNSHSTLSEGLEKTEEAIAHVSDMVRNISHALSPVMLEQVGFKTSIEKISDIINASGKVNVQLIILGFDDLKPALNHFYTEVHGMVYELINNLVKHSKAKHALVQITEDNDAFTIMVEDDGIGFMQATSPDTSTHGLAAMQSKIALMKGAFSIDKNFPQGTIVSIYIPIETNDLQTDTGR